ncbi:MAG: RNA pseudouridine synthase [Eubacteriales bacterium]
MELNIIFEDRDIILCHKMAGIATQTAKLGQRDMVSEIKNYLAQKDKNKRGEPYVGVIHRLDQPVEGLLLFAKTKEAAKELSAQVEKHVVKKYYLATVCGKLREKEGVLVDYLIKDGRSNTSRIGKKGDKEAKLSKLSYQVIEEKEEVTAIEILLETGRHHQIRVQFSNLGHPLLGDLKYGTEKSEEISKKLGINDVSLCAYKLGFNHPSTRKKMEFTIKPTEKL